MYDELLAAVRARVNRYVNSGDTEDILDPSGVRDARALMAAAHELHGGRSGRRAQASLLDAQHAAGLLYYARHIALPPGDDETDLNLGEPLLRPVFDHVPELTDQVEQLAEVPRRPVRLNPQHAPAFTFAGSPLNEIDTVVAVTRHAIRAADDGTDVLPLRMNVAEAQQLRYGRTGDVADLTDAVNTARDVLAATPPDDPMYTNRLTTLGGYLQIRFASTADGADLDASIETYREALAGAPADHEDRPMYLSNLGRARLTRFAYASADQADLDAAVEMISAAVDTTPEGDLARGTRFGALNEAYVLRFGRTDDLADLDVALHAAYQAVEATPIEHPDRVERILAVGATHVVRYERTGDKQDAATAIDVARQIRRGVPKDHPLHEAAGTLLDHARRRR